MATDVDETSATTPALPYELVWSGSWSGDDLMALVTGADLRRFGIRRGRLPQSALAAVSAAVEADRQVEGLISQAGELAGVVIGLHWLSDDGTYAFLRQLATGKWSQTAVQDFAHMGGSSLFYYIAISLGVRGYSTCVFESTGWAQTTAVRRDIAIRGLLDVILTLRISRREERADSTTGPCRGGLVPQIDSVAADVHRHPSSAR